MRDLKLLILLEIAKFYSPKNSLDIILNINENIRQQVELINIDGMKETEDDLGSNHEEGLYQEKSSEDDESFDNY